MASSKNQTEALIGGKVFTLSGFESEEYLQKISSYLNHKMEECAQSDSYRKQSADARSVLLALNVADDYFKAKKQASSLEGDLETDGVVGALTWSELRNSEFIIHHSELGNGASSGVILSGAEGEVEGSLTKYSVTISGLDLTQARALQANYPGSEIRKGTE